MSDLRVQRVRSIDGSAVEFVDGVSGDASGLRFDPLIVGYSPTPLSTNINPNTTEFIFTFNQPIEFSGIGTIRIREGSPTGTIVESFTCGVSVGATIAGETLRLNRQGGNLTGSQNYVITLPSVGIANTYGQYYKGGEGYTFQTSATEFEIQGGDYVFTVNDSNSPTNYYRYNIFSNPGILTATAPSATAVDMQVMMIGGGGAGGSGLMPSPSQFPSYQNRASGGGGAGGYLTFTGPTFNIPVGNYDVEVGAGGTAWRNDSPFYPQITPMPARNGSNTTVTSPTITYTVVGGGYGGNWHPGGDDLNLSDIYEGHPGGSGGGGAAENGSGSNPTWGSKGNGTGGQGNPGAPSNTANYLPNGSPTPYSYPGCTGGGGGGSGAAGAEGTYASGGPTTTRYYRKHGNGGVGTQNPAFTGPVLAPRISIPDATAFNRLGPTNNYWAGGGAGGGVGAGNQSGYAESNIGGYGGGGDSSSPYNLSGPSPLPNTPNPGYGANGASLTGGGGGGGFTVGPSNPTDTMGGNGGPGSIMIRYAHPGS